MAACKIDGMLKVYFFFGEHGLVQFEQQQRDAHRNKPGKHPANGNLVKNDGIKGHDLTPMIKGIQCPGQFPKRRDRCLRQQAGPIGNVAS
jgi:hypothetical protein